LCVYFRAVWYALTAVNKEVLSLLFNEFSNGVIAPELTSYFYSASGSLLSSTVLTGSDLVAIDQRAEINDLCSLGLSGLIFRDKNVAGDNAMSVIRYADNIIRVELKLPTSKPKEPNILYRSGNQVLIS